MPTQKAEAAKRMDDVQAALRPALGRWGFRGRGRAFNRATSDGLTQVISFQMGAFDPPGTVPIPGFRETLYGRFTVNLGVYVPEVTKHRGIPPKGFVHEHHCCLRARLGTLGPERTDLWWTLGAGGAVGEVELRLERDALPFMERFATRDAILANLLGPTTQAHTAAPRIVCGIILAERGRREEARRLLLAQATEDENPAHAAYVRELAEKLGLGDLDA